MTPRWKDKPLQQKRPPCEALNGGCAEKRVFESTRRTQEFFDEPPLVTPLCSVRQHAAVGRWHQRLKVLASRRVAPTLSSG